MAPQPRTSGIGAHAVEGRALISHVTRGTTGEMKKMRRAALVFLAILSLVTPTLAQEPRSPCPPGNLLATARLSDSLDVQGSYKLVADGAVLPEGAAWSAQQTIQFQTAAGSLTFDLAAEVPIAAAFLQADAKTTFSLQVSVDGRNFREIWRVPAATRERGMRERFKTFPGINTRFVRFGEATGSGFHSLSELQIFCQRPSEWPPQLNVVQAVGENGTAAGPWNRPTRRVANAIKMALGFLGAALLMWGYRLKRRGVPDRRKKLCDVLLIVLGVLGLTGYYNWGFYHFPGRIHDYEFFHYFVGAKYFPELGYTGLYECANLAEAEQGFRRRVELRNTRDLRKNERVPAKYVLEDPERYKKGFIRPFTPQRWEEFKKDVAYFRGRVSIARWERMLQDHGYNPSPVWNMAGSLLANFGPASQPLIEGVLGWIDPILLLIAFGFIGWAFGWRVACVSILFFGTNEPALYFWTGGGYIRQDWFLWAVGGICLLKRGKLLLGGASLAVSTLLRVFPIGFFVAIGLRLLWIFVSERRIDRAGARIVIGAALATAILLPASSVVAGGFSAWPEFIKNTSKHASTPLTNHMGLRTVVGFRWETRQKVMYDPGLVDPFYSFREARKSAFRGTFGLPLFIVLAGAYLALLFSGVRREMEWWVLAAFGFGVIPILLELTCYYYSFLVAAAFLWEKRDEIPIGLLALSGLSHVIAFSTYHYDIRYVLESVAALTFVVWATWIWARRPKFNVRIDANEGPRTVR